MRSCSTPPEFGRAWVWGLLKARSANRGGNRQLNRAFHIIALAQARHHPPAKEYIERKRSEGKTHREALRALKRQLVRTVFRLLQEGAASARMAA